MSQPKQPSNLCHNPNNPTTYVIVQQLMSYLATYVTTQQLMLQPSNLCYSPATYVTAQQLMSQPSKGRV
jgi:hypothetical protein